VARARSDAMMLAMVNTLVIWLFACRFLPGDAKTKRDETAVPLPRHSFSSPILFQDTLEDWAVGGSSVFERDRLQLLPAVSDRLGMLWSKLPLKTGNFEMIVHFRYVGEKAPMAFAADQSMAVWYVEENLTKAYAELPMGAPEFMFRESVTSAGITFSGSKAKFKGIGVILANADAKKYLQPSLSLVANNNDKDIQFGKDVPQASGKNMKAVDFRNTLNSAQLRIRVHPEYLEAQFKQSPSLSWQDIFKIDRRPDSNDITLPDTGKGYVGVTAWSGAVPKHKHNVDAITITQVEMHNFDDTSIGEEMRDVSAKIQEAYRDMLTDENRHFIDQKSQMEHLQRLTGMLSDHVQEAKPADTKIYEDLQNFHARMSKLDNECRTLAKEFEILVNPAGGAGVGAVKDEIVGLRRLLIKDSHQHRQTLDQVSKNIKEVKEKNSQGENPVTLNTISTQSQTLEKTVEARSSQMSWMMVILIACVAVIGFLMYNRMHYYEKKHFI
jgi:hypothetical protein